MSEPTGAADQQARRDALTPDRSFIVQAPAGSGKTELLIQRFLRLLATVDEPEEVLAITFTNKAAAEMRHRVLLAIERAEGEEAPEAPHERLTWDLARAVLERNDERSWRLRDNAGRLRIQTLDALNARIARMQPMTNALSSFGSRIPGEAGLSSLYRQAAAATLDYLAEPGQMRNTVETVVTHLDGNLETYLGRIASMLKSRDQWLPVIGVGELDNEAADRARTRLEAHLRDAVENELEPLAAGFSDAQGSEFVELACFSLENRRADGKAFPDIRADELAALPGTSAAELDRWQALAALMLTKPSGQKAPAPFKSPTKTQGFPAQHPEGKANATRYVELMDDLQSGSDVVERLASIHTLPAPAYSDEQWAVLRALLELLQLATAELRRLFLSTGTADYIETGLNAMAALGSDEEPTDLALLLDYRIRHILVDEMQDTSLVQYRLLERLTAGWTDEDGRTLFCVGDPMQSIYRFRNAEVAQFLVAQQKGIGIKRLTPLTLRRNFRSGERLIDWFNATFSSVFPGTDDPDRGAVSYAESVTADHLKGRGEVHVHPVLGTSQRHEAATTAGIVESLRDRHPDDNIAILVRGRTQLRELIPILRERDVPFQAVDIDRLTDLPEIIDALILTRVLVHKGDRHAWLAFLRAPWAGLEWSDLLALVRGDRRTPVPTLLKDETRLSQLSQEGRAIVDRLRPIVDEIVETSRTERLRGRVESLWMRLGGPVWLKDDGQVEHVHRYLDVLSTLENHGTLTDVALLERQLDEERTSSVADAKLSIMTMHKAKGLQFDHVILHGLSRRPKGNTSQVLNWLETATPDGEERLLMAPVARSDSDDRDPVHQYLHTLNNEKSRFEMQRLLYVACTRAKSTLHLVGHCELKDSEELRVPTASTLMRLLWPIVEPDYVAALERGDAVVNDTDAAEWIEPRLRRLDAGWAPPPIEKLPNRVVAARDAAPPRRFDWAGNVAMTAGVIVHRWLHGLSNGRFWDLTTDAERRRALTLRWTKEEGVRDTDAVVSRVDDALLRLLDDERGRWLLSGDGHAELPLTGLLDDGRIATGIIDRVRIDGDEHWIVDYKTSVHEGGDLERFVSEEVRLYREQLERYVTLYEGWTGIRAKAALYFPLLARFEIVEL